MHCLNSPELRLFLCNLVDGGEPLSVCLEDFPADPLTQLPVWLHFEVLSVCDLVILLILVDRTEVNIFIGVLHRIDPFECLVQGSYTAVIEVLKLRMQGVERRSLLHLNQLLVTPLYQ